MGYGRPIFDDEDTLSLHCRTVIELDWRRRAHHDRPRVDGPQALLGEPHIGLRFCESVLLMTSTSAMRATASPGSSRRNLSADVARRPP